MALKLSSIAVAVHGCHGFSTPGVNLRHGNSGHTGHPQTPGANDPDAGMNWEAVPDEIIHNGGIGLGATMIAAAGFTAAVVGNGRRSMPLRTMRRATASVTAGTAEPIPFKWDPLNLGSTEAKMERYTTVEVKHGRISMIACAGYVLPTFFRFPGCESFKNGLGAFDSIPPEGWAQIFCFIGAHEIFVRPRSGGYGGYDVGLGTELIEEIDPVEIERRMTVERNNGRLAMIGIMGLMVQDGLFGVDPITYMQKEGWWGQPVDWLVKDLPICIGGGYGGCAVRPPKRGPGLTAMNATGITKRRVDRSKAGLTTRRVVVFDDPWPKVGVEEQMSESLPYLKYPTPLRGWVGGDVGFDPLNITWAWPVYITREAELKHGRVCMLATIGWIATDLGARFPADIFQKATTISAHDDMVAAGLMQPFLATLGCMELYGGWLFFQGWRYNVANGGLNRDAGDFFVGKRFLPQDADQADSMKLKEIKNGRLAMLGFSGIVTQAVLTNSTFPFF